MGRISPPEGKIDMNRAKSRLASLKRLLAEIHRRLEPGFRIPPVGRLEAAGNLAVRCVDARHRRRRRGRRAPQGAQHHNLRQSLGGGAYRPCQRHDLRSRGASAEGPHPRTAQVARLALDPARARPVPVRSERRPMAARCGRPRSRERRIGGREHAQHRLSLRRLQRLLRPVARPGHGLHLRLFSRLERQSRHRAAAEARHDLSQAQAPAGRDLARHRQRLGLARLPRG